jgi:hypothetical protein
MVPDAAAVPEPAAPVPLVLPELVAPDAAVVPEGAPVAPLALPELLAPDAPELPALPEPVELAPEPAPLAEPPLFDVPQPAAAPRSTMQGRSPAASPRMTAIVHAR